MTRDEFVARYGSIYEHSPWVAERAWDGGTVEGEDLAARFEAIVERAGHDAQLALLRAHPDLAGRVGVAVLTAESAAEQASAGLDQCTPQEASAFLSLNETYTTRFGFPFILAVRGRSRGEILDAFRARVANGPEAEFGTALGEVHKIARLRLDAMANPPAPPKQPIAMGELRSLVKRALERAGGDAATVEAVADTVMAAEDAGSLSHGVFRIPAYCAALMNGVANGSPDVRVLEGPGAVVRVDGGGGFSQVAYRVALPALAERTREMGAAVLALTHTRHFAAMWHETEWLAERGLAAFACTANFPYLAPHGGTRPIFGTNPIAFAYPHRPHPVVFDFAASAMARGDIMMAARDGRSLPLGVGIDSAGKPTSDPDAILAGAQLPFGAHKGSAVALMVELLCGGVAGDGFSYEADPDSSGVPPGAVFMLALSPDAIGGAAAREKADAFIAMLGREPGVRIPGARRHTVKGRSSADVPSTLLAQLQKLAGADPA